MLRPALLENETVYGWLTRRHLTLGVGHPQTTLLALLGCEKARIHPYLPNHIDMLAANTQTTADMWLQDHTLYPLFNFFNEDNSGNLKSAMFGNEANVIGLANIAQSKLQFEFGHRYCPTCIANAKRARGFGIIDIRHQIPGIYACPEHGCELNVLSCGDYGLDRMLTYSLFDLNTKPASPAKVNFAKFCIDVFEQVRQQQTPINIDELYQQHLKQRGYLAGCGQLKYQKLVNDMTEFYLDFEFTDGLEPLEHFHFLGPLLRKKTHTHVHPTKHLIFSYWLFYSDPNAFWLPIVPDKSLSNIPKPSINIEKDIKSLLKSGLSMEAIHLKTGKSRCYIRRVCELNGIEHQTNANANSEKQRESVITQAKLGRHRKAIADDLNLGLGYVEQVISNTPGLVADRKNIRVLRKVRAAYRELIQARKRHPDWYRKDYKKSHNQAFFYLYHHAKRLLEKVLPPKLPPIRAKLDWQKEDERLYNAISNLDDAEQLCVSAIGHKVQDHAHLRRNLASLPKTKALLIQLGKYQ